MKRKVPTFVVDPNVPGMKFAHGWAFAVPEAFRAALGLTYARRKNGNVWIDTGCPDFQRGDTLYTSPAAYSATATGANWMVIQVTGSTPGPLGDVHYRWYHGNQHKVTPAPGGYATTTQRDFVELLRAGPTHPAPSSEEANSVDLHDPEHGSPIS